MSCDRFVQQLACDKSCMSALKGRTGIMHGHVIRVLKGPPYNEARCTISRLANNIARVICSIISFKCFKQNTWNRFFPKEIYILYVQECHLRRPQRKHNHIFDSICYKYMHTHALALQLLVHRARRGMSSLNAQFPITKVFVSYKCNAFHV